jgi:uncharacterized protein YkwD
VLASSLARGALIGVVGLAFLASATPGTPPPAASAARTPTVATQDAFADELLRLINELRAQHGLRPLVPVSPYALLATRHSEDMLARGFFGHDVPNGMTFEQRVGGFLRREGYRRWFAEENVAVAMGAPDPQLVFQDWLNSPPHLANMLSPNPRAIGIGTAHVDVGVGVFEGDPDVSTVTAIFGPPQPALRESVLVTSVRGTVLVRLAGQTEFRPLSTTTLIMAGSEVETINGRVRLTSAADETGLVQTADFYQGRFVVGYTDDFPEISPPQVVTNLTLSGSLSGCAKKRKASRRLAVLDARRPAKPKQRRLWGSGNGKFRTNGKYASATVRGTTWLTQDECTSTLIRVRGGRVDAFDFRLRRHVLLRPGQTYVARSR